MILVQPMADAYTASNGATAARFNAASTSRHVQSASLDGVPDGARARTEGVASQSMLPPPTQTSTAFFTEMDRLIADKFALDFGKGSNHAGIDSESAAQKGANAFASVAEAKNTPSDIAQEFSAALACFADEDGDDDVKVIDLASDEAVDRSMQTVATAVDAENGRHSVQGKAGGDTNHQQGQQCKKLLKYLLYLMARASVTTRPGSVARSLPRASLTTTASRNPSAGKSLRPFQGIYAAAFCSTPPHRHRDVRCERPAARRLRPTFLRPGSALLR